MLLVCTMCFLLLLFGCGADEVSQKVMDDISSIGEVELDNEELINWIGDRYETLTDRQKSKVKNYKSLLDAKSELRNLKFLNIRVIAEKLVDVMEGDTFGLIDESLALSIYRLSDIDYKIVRNCTILSSGTTVNEVMIIQCRNKLDKEDVRKVMQERLKNQADLYILFAPDEVPKLHDPIIMELDNYIALCVTDKLEESKEILHSYNFK